MKLIDTFSGRLQKALDYSNMKQVDLVEKTGLDKTLINKYLAGIMKAKQDKLSILAKALNVNEVWLMGYDIPMDRNIIMEKIDSPVISIPLIATVKADYDYMVAENLQGTVNVDKSLICNGSDFFAIQVRDDSMSPMLLNKDIVIIHKQNYCNNNQICLVTVNGEEGTLKRVIKTETEIILQPLNPTYTTNVYSNEDITSIPITIIGIVVQLRREF